MPRHGPISIATSCPFLDAHVFFLHEASPSAAGAVASAADGTTALAGRNLPSYEKTLDRFDKVGGRGEDPHVSHAVVATALTTRRVAV